MNQPPVIVIINKKPYTLNTVDNESLQQIPAEDRRQLVTLLEKLKQLDAPVQSTSRPKTLSSESLQAVMTDPVNQAVNSGRLHSGDADAVMAQLIMEDKLNKKPPLTKHVIHKWLAVVMTVIVLTVFIFS